MKSELPIPIVLVTGFLGSGKTTFLRRLAEDHPIKRLLFLVNEIAGQSVDGPDLSLTGRPAHSVVGGSLFCECKAGEFVRVMREEVREQHRANPLDAVVIETSGIADPAAIGRLMRDHGLADFFAIARIVAVVAPRRFRTLVENLPTVRAQIETSDLIVVNKTDLATAKQIEDARSLIREIRPRAEVQVTSFGRVKIGFDDLNPTLPEAELATCEANPFTTEAVQLSGPISESALAAWLEMLPDSILRVKGTVLTTTGWRRVQGTVDSGACEPCDEQPNSSLVIIAHDDDEALLREAVRNLEAALHETV